MKYCPLNELLLRTDAIPANTGSHDGSFTRRSGPGGFMTEGATSLIDVAIGVERRGIAFYDTVARSTQNEGARDVFRRLSEMERQHIAIFEKMLSEPYNIADYNATFRTLIENSVFSGEQLTSQTALDANTDIKALELGIAAEKDSILLYFEMRDLLPTSARGQINLIITEEKRHLSELSNLKKEIENRES